MWAQIIVAVLELVLKVWGKREVIAADAPANPGLRDKLDAKLDAWKKKAGAP